MSKLAYRSTGLSILLAEYLILDSLCTSGVYIDLIVAACIVFISIAVLLFALILIFT